MNRRVTQQPPEVAKQQQQMRQMQSNKVTRGLRTGIELLEDKNVVAPIAMHGGLTDLEWILRGLLGGQFALDLNPQGEAGRVPEPTDSAKRIAALELADEDGGEGSSGNGSTKID